MLFDSWVEILLGLGNKFSSLLIFAYFLTRIKVFRKTIAKKELRLKDILFLSVIFGSFGIFGTYFSFEYNGALINTRLIGVASGGLIGGPVVGLLSGLIAGVHRGMINAGNVTSTACAISTVFEGLMAGCMGLYIKDKNIKWRYALLTGVIGESMRKVALLIMVKPFSVALDLVRDIWLPMVLINSLGLAMFFIILESIFKDHEKMQAKSAQLSLKIVDEALPYLRMGFDNKEFSKVAEIIYSRTDFNAVTVTNREKIIAHVGESTIRHGVGKPIVTDITAYVLKSGNSKVLDRCDEMVCDYKENCKLKSILTLPLSNGETVVGTLKLYKRTTTSITELDVELGEGLAKLISTELKISKLEIKEKLLKEAEYRALQSQINPHFLFNSLTVIGSICRTEPLKARELIGSLSEHFRKTINTSSDMVSIEEEIEHVKSYVSIEKARLSEDLEVIYDVEGVSQFSIPPLTLQPMIENAIKHGIYPKKGKGIIRFTIGREAGEYVIRISDDGVGMSADIVGNIMQGHLAKENSYGTNNVIERMKSAFEDRFTYDISSALNEGTEVVFRIREEGKYA